MGEHHSVERRYWFRAKNYGWGWTPCSWEGWLAMVIWAVVFTACILGSAVASSTGNWAAFAALLTLAVTSILSLALVGWQAGERPHWRWGR